MMTRPLLAENGKFLATSNGGTGFCCFVVVAPVVTVTKPLPTPYLEGAFGLSLSLSIFDSINVSNLVPHIWTHPHRDLINIVCR